MISREDTVSLSNMSATSEKPFIEGEISESEKGGVGKLVKMKMKTKVEGSTLNKKGWKITTFEKSPPVSALHVLIGTDLTVGHTADVLIFGCFCKWSL